MLISETKSGEARLSGLTGSGSSLEGEPAPLTSVIGMVLELSSDLNSPAIYALLRVLERWLGA
jgi:hypothetical protein